MTQNRKTSRIGITAAVCMLLAGGLLYLGSPRGKTVNASGIPDLLSALPAGAPTLAYLDLAAVRTSSFYQHRPDKGPIAVPNQDYADFVSQTGFNFEKDLDRLAMASWPPATSKGASKTVVIAEGRFDRPKIRDYAARMGKLDHQQGHEVFLFPSNDHKGMNSFTFVDDHRVAFVAGTSIAPLLAPSGDASAADPARERAARLDGAAAFVISTVPPIPDNSAAAGGMQGAATEQLMGLARSLRWLTLAVRPEGDDLRLSLEGECDNETNARQIQSMLELLRMFGRAGLESPKNKQSMDPATLSQLENLLSSAAITQAGERVRILIELTPDIFKLRGPAAPSGTALRSSRP
jgi:hypothetical protein